MPYPLFQQGYQFYNPNNYQQIQQQPQIQNGGFVFVKNEEEFINYPVAPGNSVTFKNESQPYIYTKTLGFSQLDRPILEKFRLVKEDLYSQETTEVTPETPEVEYLSVNEADVLKKEINSLKEEIEFLKEYIESEKGEVKDV